MKRLSCLLLILILSGCATTPAEKVGLFVFDLALREVLRSEHDRGDGGDGNGGDRQEEDHQL